MLDALRATLQRLGTERLDLWQIHFPFPSYPQATLADGLREAYEAGLVSSPQPIPHQAPSGKG